MSSPGLAAVPLHCAQDTFLGCARASSKRRTVAGGCGADRISVCQAVTIARRTRRGRVRQLQLRCQRLMVSKRAAPASLARRDCFGRHWLLSSDCGRRRSSHRLSSIASTAKLCRCAQTSDVRELPEASCRLTAEALVCLLCTNLVYLYQPQHLSIERTQPGDGICHGDNARACDGHTLS